jgi:hypothetical protein
MHGKTDQAERAAGSDQSEPTAPLCCFDAFSSRDPASTSLENADRPLIRQSQFSPT